MRRGLPIATQDQKLVKAEADTGVHVLQPYSSLHDHASPNQEYWSWAY